MELLDVVDTISSILGVNLVLHRSILILKIKVYKKFVYNLYLINGDKLLIFSAEYVFKTPNGELDKRWEEIDKRYLNELLNWYKYGNELVLDSLN